MRWLGIISALALLSIWMYKAVYTWLPNHYIFDPATINEICNDALAKYDTTSADFNLKDLLTDVRNELASHYGDKFINEMVEEDWLFNNAGGAMGQMLVLHASFSEYLIFFGSMVGTEGHTGIHFADDYFTILHGQQYAANASALTKEVYKPGMTHHLPLGHVKQYGMEPGTFAVELAQGWIPCMLPFGILDTFTSTMDFITLYQTVKVSATNMLRNFLVNRKF
ncbi:HER166Wp [Eremothecium sinecaudum]|uniref:C-8 sterol isomerase n=1 Tax=Eremothecium sinecaudum TaxID=45286 RepID=A0A0X8HTZ4_9SACH|nr:HER166Wp [Eremothecium sinecaudum]AMD21445.1 HER166Wp [Eremothecium sinecaudum]